MSESLEQTLCEARHELQVLYEGSTDGILVVNAGSQRFVRANGAICRFLGYSEEEMLSLSVGDIHPAEHLPKVQEQFEAMCERRLASAQNVPCLRKDGRVVYADITAEYLDDRPQPLVLGFFRDVTEQNRTIELLRTSEERYRLIAENVADIIWTAPVALSPLEKTMAQTDIPAVIDAVLERWHFSFVSPASTHVLGYTPDEIANSSIRDIMTPTSYASIRQAMIDEFPDSKSETGDNYPQHTLEAELFAKDGSWRYCEIVSTYLRDEEGIPTAVLGVARDISGRREAERALSESESKLRSLFDNLPDVVATVDRDAAIYFVNRGAPGMDRDTLQSMCGFSLVAPEHQQLCRGALHAAFETGQPQMVEFQDIFGGWWSVRAALLAEEADGERRVLVICTDITQERLAAEAIGKEQRLLRQLLELHERERRLTAYEIHDGFAQQLTGALFRLQSFRQAPACASVSHWEDFDAAVRLVTRAIDEARRLISGLRPPILDESGIIRAVEYLVCEHEKDDGPRIEFVHQVAFDRLAPPLESAIFRIVQESLQNARQHSRSDRVRIALTQCDDRVHIDIRDWGVGFSTDAVEEQRFGLQGIRERARLLDGRVVIESAPGKGTHISVELPLVNGVCRRPEVTDACVPRDMIADDTHGLAGQ